MKKLIKPLLLLYIIFSNQLFAHVNLDSGLVASYPFNNNANDESGNNNHGTIHGPLLTSDRFGNPNSAFSFDGINDYITVKNAESIRIKKSITVSAWMKTSDPQPDVPYPNQAFGTIISLTCTHGSGSYSFYASKYYKSTGMSIAPYNATTQNKLGFFASSECNIFNNNWHFVVGIYDYDSGLLKIYINNILRAIVNCGRFELFNLDYLPLLIGATHLPDDCIIGRNYFTGLLDDLRLYNRALNEEEITALYQFPKPFSNHYPELNVNIKSNSPICEGDSLIISVDALSDLYYQWTLPNGSKSNFKNLIIPYTRIVEHNGKYSLKVSNGDTCTVTNYIIDVNIVKPFVSITGDTTICDGDSTILTADYGFLDYSWSTGERKRQITVKQPGLYTVNITDTNGCTASKSVNVISKTVSEIAFRILPEKVCDRDSLFIFVIGEFVEFLWSTGEKDNYILVKQDGEYSVTVTDSNGCTASKSIKVEIHSSPLVEITAHPEKVCEGDSTILTATDGFSEYTWSTGEKSRNIIVKAPGEYIVSVKDSNGCTGTQEIVVNFLELPEVLTTAIPDKICEGDSALLIATDGFQSYKWYNAETNERIFGASDSVYVTKPGKYRVVVKNENGCEAVSDDIVVNMLPTPEFEIKYSKNHFCNRDSIVIYLTGKYDSCVWYDAETNEKIAENIDSLLLKKNCKLFIKATNEYGCEAISELINIQFDKELDVLINASKQFLCDGDSVLLSVSNDFESYEWFYEELDNQKIGTEKSVFAKKSGKYYIRVRDIFGCEALDEITINIKPQNDFLFKFIDDNTLDLDTVNYGGTNCKTLQLTNNSQDTLILLDLPLKFNICFSIPQSILPLIFLPNDTKSVKICFYPDSLGYFEDEINYQGDCGISFLKLKGFCRANFYDTESKCNINLDLVTSDVLEKRIIVSIPYPNPANNYIYLPFSAFTDNENNFDCKIYNNFGRELKSGSLSLINTFTKNEKVIRNYYFVFDVQDLNNGIYFIVFKSNDMNLSQTFIISN